MFMRNPQIIHCPPGLLHQVVCTLYIQQWQSYVGHLDTVQLATGLLSRKYIGKVMWGKAPFEQRGFPGPPRTRQAPCRSSPCSSSPSRCPPPHQTQGCWHSAVLWLKLRCFFFFSFVACTVGISRVEGRGTRPSSERNGLIGLEIRISLTFIQWKAHKNWQVLIMAWQGLVDVKSKPNIR